MTEPEPAVAPAARRHWVPAAWAGGAALVLDQATKAWILAIMTADPREIVVTPFLSLVLVWNRGISFGLFGDAGEETRWLLVALAAAICVVLLFWLRRAETRLAAVGIGLVIGGAVGNVIDRVRLGAVVDFVDLHGWGWHWPAFNVADTAITVGVAALLADSLFGRR